MNIYYSTIIYSTTYCSRGLSMCNYSVCSVQVVHRAQAQLRPFPNKAAQRAQLLTNQTEDKTESHFADEN